MEQVQETTPAIKDVDILAEWRSMLDTFAGIIDKNPPVEKVKDDLLELKEAAKASNLLTGLQVSAICTRCDNYINGVYGKNKTKDEYMANHSS